MSTPTWFMPFGYYCVSLFTSAGRPNRRLMIAAEQTHSAVKRPSRDVRIVHCAQGRAGLFKMTVWVQLSSGNSAPNSGNSHRLAALGSYDRAS